ncbi:hypothetical protein [Salinicoccus sp. YB14-2]|uniref:hypothetical protein n=1 Tax=Salinicoccus sp. YB14-2 TaxID=1572701 RepID=UPI00068C50C4|nr:hypothetical protein [Salinicoccus sp. YB14-2]
MILRIIMYIGLGLLSIFLINYFEFANIEFTIINVLIAVGSLIALKILYSIFTRFLRVLVFAFVFLPVIGLVIYYVYAYFTGQSVDLASLAVW